MSLARLDIHGRTLVVVNDNAAKRGALSPDLYGALNQALTRASEPEFRAIVLASVGGFFCSGGDLNTLKERRLLSLEQRRAKVQELHDIITRIRACPLPVIAAVEGLARPVTADRLAALGVVTTLCEAGAALAEAHACADALARGPREATGTIKALVGAAYETRESAQLDAERDAMIRAVAGPEAEIGIAAFLNKQKPDYP